MLNFTFPFDDISSQRIYNQSEIDKIFLKIVSEYQIDFDFLQGGCQQRSHLLSMILAKEFDIQNSKIWLFSPAALYENDNRSLFVSDFNNYDKSGIVNWNYHTAPIVKVWVDGKVEILVFDPCINKKNAISLNDWLAAIGNSGIGMYTFLYKEKYFFNCKYNEFAQLTNIFDGTFFEFENPAKDNLVLEKGLAVNDTAMAIYKNYISNKIKSVGDIVEYNAELSEIFGNATVLDLLFAQNLSGNTENTSYRYILYHYENIMQEALLVFHKRLIFWTRFTSNLINKG